MNAATGKPGEAPFLASTSRLGEGEWRTCTLESDAELISFEADWRRLAAAVPEATCFMWPAYFQAWRRTLADGTRPAVLATYNGAELRAVLAIMQGVVWRGPSCDSRIDYGPGDSDLVPQRWRRPLRLRQLSSVVSWRATCIRPSLLCRRDDLELAVRSMAGALLRQPRWDVIVLPVAAGRDGTLWRNAFFAHGVQPILHHLGRKVLTIDPLRSFDAIVAEQSRHFRQNVRRARAAAGREGLQLALVEGHEAVTGELRTLARIASASWKHGGRVGALGYEGAQQRFFETLLADRSSGLTPVLSIATLAGEPTAILLALRHGATATTMLTFRDERTGATSPGLLMLGQLIDWAAEQGLARFDLNSTQDWLRHLANRRTLLENLVIFGPTLAGRAGAAISDLRRRIAGRNARIAPNDQPSA